MQPDLFKCLCCSQPPDLQLHAPKFLLYCPPFVCQRCLQNVFLTQNCPSTLHSLENLPTDLTLLQSPQTRPKMTLGDDTRFTRKRASTGKRKGESQPFLQDKVRKKQKTEQEIDGELLKLQESIKQQFLGMRRMLHTSQSIDENPFAEITTKLKGMFIETEEALSTILNTSESQQMLRGLSPENKKANQATISSDEMKEEFLEEEEEEEKLQSQDQFIQETNVQVMELEEEEPKIKLDFSDKDISDAIITTLCSEDFWTGIDKTTIYYLELNFSSSTLTDQQFIKLVYNVISPMKNLTSLILNLAKTQISNESIQILSQQFLKDSPLTTFKLNCSQTSVGDECFASLDDGLNSSIKTLENLEVILDDTCLQGEKFLDVLSRFGKLKHLKLSFEDSQISSEIVSSIVFSLYSLGKTLESLELNFNGTGIDDESLEKFPNPILSQMERLRHFKFSIGGIYVSKDFLWDFSQGLSPLAAELRTLELDLHSTELFNLEFKQFCEEVLGQIQNLENLRLDLSHTKITDASLKSLILPVQKLKSLTLNLSNNKIYDSGLQSFRENNNFKNLKSIDFRVGQTGVTDAALQDFLRSVKARASAQVLSPQHGASSEYSFDPEDHLHKEPNPKNGSKTEILDPKGKVFAELKKELNLYYGRKQDPEKLGTHRVFKSIKKLSPEVYDSILAKILTNTLSLSRITAEEIERWKKTIQTMISVRLEMISQGLRKCTGSKRKETNIERKQICGNNDNHHLGQTFNRRNDSTNNELLSELVLSFKWLKKYGREICFREKVIEILKSMKTRTFSVLHEKLLKFIRELSNNYGTWRMSPTLENTTYSFSWWYRFIGKDHEIMNLWRSLPPSHNLPQQKNQEEKLKLRSDS